MQRKKPASRKRPKPRPQSYGLRGAVYRPLNYTQALTTFGGVGGGLNFVQDISATISAVADFVSMSAVYKLYKISRVHIKWISVNGLNTLPSQVIAVGYNPTVYSGPGSIPNILDLKTSYLMSAAGNWTLTFPVFYPSGTTGPQTVANVSQQVGSIQMYSTNTNLSYQLGYMEVTVDIHWYYSA